MLDGFTDPFITLIFCQFATKPLIIIGRQYTASALCPASVLMCQCVHTCFGYMELICICTPPENDLQSIDREAHRLEHNKTVVYVWRRVFIVKGERHLVLEQCRAPWELTRQGS